MVISREEAVLRQLAMYYGELEALAKEAEGHQMRRVSLNLHGAARHVKRAATLIKADPFR